MTVDSERKALLPCPFCGGPVTLERAHKSRDKIYGEREWWGVVCRNTMNRGGTCAIQQRPSASQEAAVERWNRRAEGIAAPPRELTEDESAMLTRALYRSAKVIHRAAPTAAATPEPVAWALMYDNNHWWISANKQTVINSAREFLTREPTPDEIVPLYAARAALAAPPAAATPEPLPDIACEYKDACPACLCQDCICAATAPVRDGLTHPCAKRCQYAQDIAMPEHSCGNGCMYDKASAATAPADGVRDALRELLDQMETADNSEQRAAFGYRYIMCWDPPDIVPFLQAWKAARAALAAPPAEEK